MHETILSRHTIVEWFITLVAVYILHQLVRQISAFSFSDQYFHCVHADIIPSV